MSLGRVNGIPSGSSHGSLGGRPAVGDAWVAVAGLHRLPRVASGATVSGRAYSFPEGLGERRGLEEVRGPIVVFGVAGASEGLVGLGGGGGCLVGASCAQVVVKELPRAFRSLAGGGCRAPGGLGASFVSQLGNSDDLPCSKDRLPKGPLLLRPAHR